MFSSPQYSMLRSKEIENFLDSVEQRVLATDSISGCVVTTSLRWRSQYGKTPGTRVAIPASISGRYSKIDISVPAKLALRSSSLSIRTGEIPDRTGIRTRRAYSAPYLARVRAFWARHSGRTQPSSPLMDALATKSNGSVPPVGRPAVLSPAEIISQSCSRISWTRLVGQL